MMENNKKLFNKLNEYFKDNIKLSFVSILSTVIVTKEDKVYEFDKKHSLIELSSEKSITDSLIEDSIVEELCYKGVIDLKNSVLHSIARTNDGKVYCWGENRGGLLGNGKSDGNTLKPELNQYLSHKQVIDICCGHWHSLVLTIDGEVYAWGYNDCGQIGNGNNEDMLVPYQIKGFNEEKVKAISCGGYYSMAVTVEGHVFSWGDNDFGQLGLGVEDISSNLPKLIEMDEILIDKVSCGLHHNLLLSREGQIYVTGRNDCGELGIISESKKILTPIKLKHPNIYIDIASHPLHNILIAVSEKHLLYVWGKYGEVIKEPKETDFKSVDEAFEKYFQITYKPIEGRIIPFNDSHIRNILYNKQFNEVEKLGEGDYGEVFRVKNKLEENRKEYAIKKITFKTHTENEFIRELEMSVVLTKFHNERLVKYYDAWLEDEFIENERRVKNITLYIQMELCDKTLNAVIEDRKVLNDSSSSNLNQLGYYLASEMFIEILKGVVYLHEQNPPLIHTNLKPNNILWKFEPYTDSCVKIADFGLTIIHKFINQSHTRDIEDIRYTAPEILNGSKYDTKVDIYSLGIVLQELFVIDINRDYSHERTSLMSQYKALKDLYDKMTSNLPNRRPSCEEIMKDKHLWTLNVKEFNIRKEFENFQKSHEDKNSYVLKLIRHFLQLNNKNQDESKCTLI